jgi:tripartite-type tricarboxylate transporter receptor subunit TctC
VTRLAPVLLAIGLTAFAPCGLTVENTAGYPSRPIRLIAPQAPGGGVDLVARLLADRLRLALGQTVLVDNEAGAGGAIATQMTARAAPDGYTLEIGYVATHGTNPAVKKSGYDAVRDFTPIAMIGGTPNLLVVNHSLPVADLKEFVAYARSHPGKINYGTSGTGTLNHLVMEQFKHAANFDCTAVPYRSIGQAFTDSMGGQVQVIFPGLAAAMPHVRSGALKPLAVTGARRNPLLPDVPTFKEYGYEGFDGLTWYGVVAPAGLPPEITSRLNAEINKILATPDFRQKLADQALDTMPMTPPEFGRYIADEIVHSTRVARESKVEVQ